MVVPAVTTMRGVGGADAAANRAGSIVIAGVYDGHPRPLAQLRTKTG